MTRPFSIIIFMTFEVFGQTRVGKRGLGDNISIAKTQIYFGKNKPHFDSLIIEYDKSALQIRFSDGAGKQSFIVKSHNSGYFINAYSFTTKNILPQGRYKPVGDSTYEYIG